MNIITGATGKLGRLVVENLLSRVPADQIAISVRDPSKAADFADCGVRVRTGDFQDRDSLRHAFVGGSKLLLVSSNAAAYGGDTLLQHRNAISAAKAVGIERIFYTSQIAAAPDGHFPPGRSHYATEQMLAESGIDWTSLRHGFYSASGLRLFKEKLSTGVLRTPSDGSVAWTTHEDLALADAVLLTGSEVFDGPVTLTADAQYDFAELAVLASEMLGHPIKREVVSDNEFEKTLSGMPPLQVGFLMSYYRAARAGEFASGDSVLARLIGTRPTTMEDFLAAALST